MKPVKSARNAEIGRLGERLAEVYLEKRGVRILARNYSVHGGEIDLIGFCRGGLLYIEVKTRTGSSWGTPAEAIYEEKLRRIERAAKSFERAYVSGGKVPVFYAFGLRLPRRIRYRRVDGIEVYLQPDGSLQKINRIEDMGYEIRQHARTE